jgi:hypothetical protein
VTTRPKKINFSPKFNISSFSSRYLSVIFSNQNFWKRKKLFQDQNHGKEIQKIIAEHPNRQSFIFSSKTYFKKREILRTRYSVKPE